MIVDIAKKKDYASVYFSRNKAILCLNLAETSYGLSFVRKSWLSHYEHARSAPERQFILASLQLLESSRRLKHENFAY